MRDLICDVIDYCASSFATGKLSMWSNCNYKPENEKNVDIKQIFTQISI